MNRPIAKMICLPTTVVVRCMGKGVSVVDRPDRQTRGSGGLSQSLLDGGFAFPALL